ncbi:MAG: hypothetical protein JW924_01720, partial [Fusobacteriaceae bacterium]|nr:hypothetical protein [Fusobacteriaceae bacterium]
MDINMSNVTFIKGDDNWVYLITDGSTKLTSTNGIKVFYDDGTFKSDTESMDTYYEEYMKDLKGKNQIALLDYKVQDADFLLTLRGSAIAASDWEGLSGSSLMNKVENEAEKLNFSSLISTGALNGGEYQKWMALMAQIVLDGSSIKTAPEGEKGWALMGSLAAVYIPAVLSTMSKFNCLSFGDFVKTFINGKENVRVIEKKSSDGDDFYQSYTGNNVRNFMLTEILSNKYAADIMGSLMTLGFGLRNSKIGALKKNGNLIIAIAKPISLAIKSIVMEKLSKETYNLADYATLMENPSLRPVIPVINLLEIIKSENFIHYLDYGIAETFNQLFLDFNKYNYIEWVNDVNGKNINYFTEVELKGTIWDVVKNSFFPGTSIIKEGAYNATTIEKFNKIITNAEGAIGLINKLNEDKNIIPIRGYFKDLGSDQITTSTFYNVRFSSYFDYDAELNKLNVYILSEERENMTKYLSQLLNNIDYEKFNNLNLNTDLKIYINSENIGEVNGALQEIRMSKGTDLLQWFSLKGINIGETGFTVEDILKSNNIDYIKKANGETYFFIRKDFYNSEVLKMNLPTNGAINTEDKLILGDNNVNHRIYIGEHNEKGATINGSNGDDYIYGGLGVDTIYGHAGKDYIYGGEYDKEATLTDFYNAGLTLEELNAMSFEEIQKFIHPENKGDSDEAGDVISGGDDDDHIYGQRGEDYLYGDGGNDHIWGGADSDHLFGGAGDDFLIGGVKSTLRLKEEGDKRPDYLYGGEGDDYLLGGNGTDQYIFNVSEDSGNDYIIDADKRGIIRLAKDKTEEEKKASKIKTYEDRYNFIDITGVLNEVDFTIDGDNGKIRDFNGNLVKWEHGRLLNGRRVDNGTAITIIYTNSEGKENKISMQGFTKQYTIGGGEYLFQERIVGLKYKSLFTGDNEVANTTLEILGPPQLEGMNPIIQYGASAAYFAVNYNRLCAYYLAAIGTQLVVNDISELQKNVDEACLIDPLILDLDGDGIETSAMEEGTYFDLNGDGSKEKAGWVG